MYTLFLLSAFGSLRGWKLYFRGAGLGFSDIAVLVLLQDHRLNLQRSNMFLLPARQIRQLGLSGLKLRTASIGSIQSGQTSG